MTTIEAKLAVHQAAATLTAGVMANLPDNLTPDANILPDAQALNAMAWQVHKIFYHGIVGALNTGDEASWPTPKIPVGDVGSAGGGLKWDGSLLAAVIKAIPPEVLSALVGKIPTEALNILVGKVAPVPTPTPAPLQP